MVREVTHERVKALLKETITLLCRNGLDFKKHFNLEALIGVTLDDDKVFLMSINELVKTDDKTEELSEDEADNTKLRIKRKRKRCSTSGRKTSSSVRSEDEVDKSVHSEDVQSWSFNRVKTEAQPDDDDYDTYGMTPVSQTRAGGRLSASAPCSTPNFGTNDPENQDVLESYLVGMSDETENNLYHQRPKFPTDVDGPETDRNWYGSEEIAPQSIRQVTPEVHHGNTTSNSYNWNQRVEYKKWSQRDLNSAIDAVLNRGMSRNSAAKTFNIPTTTLNRKLKIARGNAHSNTCAQEEIGQIDGVLENDSDSRIEQMFDSSPTTNMTDQQWKVGSNSKTNNLSELESG